MNGDPTEIDLDGPRIRIGVAAAPGCEVSDASGGGTAGPQLSPGQEHMLAALERVFPVSFERLGGADLKGVDGVLVLGLGAADKPQPGCPGLVIATTADLDEASQRAALQRRGSAGSATLPRVDLSDDPALERPLRGQGIQEGAAAAATPPLPRGALTLARLGGAPVWWQAGDGARTHFTSAYPLAELGPGDTLRDHLRARCFMGLLPLVHLIRRLLGERWKAPPVQASFVVDDPNLHWPSYGFLDYRELAEHATRHGYHVGFAMVPLDGWLVNRRAASLLAENASVLSLLLHGNDHAAHELGRLENDAQAGAAVAQALRRIAAVERRCGVKVERVMVPPYEDCSRPALRAMFRLGVEATSVSRPHPWYVGPPAESALAGWWPAELVEGGLPVLPRYPLCGDRDDLPLRAYLGQPLILYGHHWDFADGLDLLAQAAGEINALGDVQWGPLGRVARAGYATRIVEDTLLVRMFTRRVAVEVPGGVRRVRVSIPEPFGGSGGHRLGHQHGSTRVVFDGGWGTSGPIAVEDRDQIALMLMADRPLRPSDVGAGRVRPWLSIRRALVEGRDRIQPMRRGRTVTASEPAAAAAS
jgi:hypothetical protein